MSRRSADGGCGGLFATAAIRRAPEDPGAEVGAAGTGAESPCPAAGAADAEADSPLPDTGAAGTGRDWLLTAAGTDAEWQLTAAGAARKGTSRGKFAMHAASTERPLSGPLTIDTGAREALAAADGF